MIAYSLGARTAREAVQVVRALGAHRYLGGRLHLVHAFAFASVPDDAGGAIAEGRAWAGRTLADPSVDAASRDERLWRRSTEAEIAAVLEAFWVAGERAAASRAALRAHLERHELFVGVGAPFDEACEEAMHPLLVDAGWELIALSSLDPGRHRGAIEAFGDALAFETACFETETAAPLALLYELPAIGPVELLLGADDGGALAAAPLVVWASGHETYVDYVLRGVRRAAKLPERDQDDDAFSDAPAP